MSEPGDAVVRRGAHRRSIAPTYKDGHMSRAQARRILDLLFIYIDDAERTLSDIAEASCVTESTLKKWKSGDRNPTLADVTRCFASLGYLLRPHFVGEKAIPLGGRASRESNGEVAPVFGSEEWQESEQGENWLFANEVEERLHWVRHGARMLFRIPDKVRSKHALRKTAVRRRRVELSKGPTAKTVK